MTILNKIKTELRHILFNAYYAGFQRCLELYDKYSYSELNALLVNDLHDEFDSAIEFLEGDKL